MDEQFRPNRLPGTTQAAEGLPRRRWTVAEIEYERRNGYAWYGAWAQKLLDKEFPAWQKKHATGNKQLAIGN